MKIKTKNLQNIINNHIKIEKTVFLHYMNFLYVAEIITKEALKMYKKANNTIRMLNNVINITLDMNFSAYAEIGSLYFQIMRNLILKISEITKWIFGKTEILVCYIGGYLDDSIDLTVSYGKDEIEHLLSLVIELSYLYCKAQYVNEEESAKDFFYYGILKYVDDMFYSKRYLKLKILNLLNTIKGYAVIIGIVFMLNEEQGRVKI